MKILYCLTCCILLMTLVQANNPPEVFVGGDMQQNRSFSFMQGDTCVRLCPNFLITDPDSTAIDIVRISFVGAVRPGERLEQAFLNGESPDYFLQLPSSNNLDDPDDYEGIIQLVDYCYDVAEPLSGLRTLRFLADDRGSDPRATSNPSFAFIDVISNFSEVISTTQILSSSPIVQVTTPELPTTSSNPISPSATPDLVLPTTPDLVLPTTNSNPISPSATPDPVLPTTPDLVLPTTSLNPISPSATPDPVLPTTPDLVLPTTSLNPISPSATPDPVLPTTPDLVLPTTSLNPISPSATPDPVLPTTPDLVLPTTSLNPVLIPSPELPSGTPAACPTELNVPLYQNSSFVYNWTKTEVGGVQTQPCPQTCLLDTLNVTTGGGSGVLVRRCVRGVDKALWEDVSVSECGLSIIALQLCEASQFQSAAETAERTAEITNDSTTLEPMDIAITSVIIEELTDAAIEDPEVREDYLQTVDNILGADPDAVLQSQSETNSSIRILESLSRFSSSVEIPQNATNTSIFFTQSTYAILVQDIQIEQFSSQAFSVDLGSVEEAIAGIVDGDIDRDRLLMALNVLPNATASAEILFDPEIVNKSGNVSNTERLFYTVFLSTSLFLTPSTDCDEFAIGSIILSVRFNVSTSNNHNLTIILNFLQKEEACEDEDDVSSSETVCANFNERVGMWSVDDCRVVSDGGSRTKCECAQPGHFGLLFDLEPGESLSPLALVLITYIGTGISSVCLIIILTTYILSRNLRSKDQGKLLINLCTSLLALYITFIICGHVTTVSVLCGFMAALLQYFMLVFFGWTAAGAVLLYRKTVTVFGTGESFVWKAAIVVWLGPLLILAVSVGPGYNHYTNPYYCRATGYPFWLGLILPFGLIYLFNWIMFIVILVSLVKGRTKSASRVDVNTIHKIRRKFVPALGLATLFGLTWGLGLAATSTDVREVTFAFQVIVSILIGSQGVLIFIFQGLRSDKVKKEWKKWFAKLCCLSKGTHMKSSVASPTSPQPFFHAPLASKASITTILSNQGHLEGNGAPLVARGNTAIQDSSSTENTAIQDHSSSTDNTAIQDSSCIANTANQDSSCTSTENTDSSSTANTAIQDGSGTGNTGNTGNNASGSIEGRVQVYIPVKWS